MTGLLRASAGLIIWAIAFTALYGLQGLSCAFGWDAWSLGGVSFARLLLLLVYVGSGVLLAFLCWAFRPRAADTDFTDRLAFTGAIAGFFSLAYTGIPVVAASVC